MQEIQNEYFANDVNKLQNQINLIHLIVFVLCISVPSFIFPQYIIGIDIFAVNLLFTIFSISFTSFFIYRYIDIDLKFFVKRLLSFCFFYCSLYIILQYILSYYYTPNLFPFVLGNGSDQYFYWKYGTLVDKALSGDHTWSFLNSYDVADRGFPVWVGIFIHIFGDIQLPIKLVNALLTGLTAITIAYSVFELTEDDILSKLSGLIYAFLPTSGYLASLFLKETLMIFIMSLWMLSLIKFIKNFSLSFGVLLVICIASLFLFRTFMGVAAIVLSLFYVSTRGMKVFLLSLVLGGLFLLGNGSKLFYASEEVNKNVSSFEKQSFYSKNKSFSTIERVGGLFVLTPLSPVMPIPSTLDARSESNKEKIGLLYRIHMELVRIVLCFFFFLGLLYLWRERGKNYLLLVAGSFLLLFVNAYVGVLTYYRYMAPALMFMVPVIAVGIVKYSENIKRNRNMLIIYTLLIIAFVSLYNIYRISII